jgi:hypothetical protein
MCYVVLLGTDADDHLSRHNAGELTFSRLPPDQSEAMLLNLPQQWVVSVGTCSCGLRHLMHPSAAFNFSEPVAWFQEHDENLVATLHVIRVIRALVAGGAAVECVDVWDHDLPDSLTVLAVDLAIVSDTGFRFFENHRFVFR